MSGTRINKYYLHSIKKSPKLGGTYEAVYCNGLDRLVKWYDYESDIPTVIDLNDEEED